MSRIYNNNYLSTPENKVIAPGKKHINSNLRRNQVSFSSANPFAGDILDIKVSKQPVVKPQNKISFKGLVSTLFQKLTGSIQPQESDLKIKGLSGSDAAKVKKFVKSQKDVEVVEAILKHNSENTKSVRKYRFFADDICQILKLMNPARLDVLETVLSAKYATSEHYMLQSEEVINVLDAVNEDNKEFVAKIINQTNLKKKEYEDTQARRFFSSDIPTLIRSITKENKQYVDKVLNKVDSTTGEYQFASYEIRDILCGLTEDNVKIFNDIIDDKRFEGKNTYYIGMILNGANAGNLKVCKRLLNDKSLSPKVLGRLIENVDSDSKLPQLETLLNPKGKIAGVEKFTDDEIIVYSKLINVNAFDALESLVKQVRSGRFPLQVKDSQRPEDVFRLMYNVHYDPDMPLIIPLSEENARFLAPLMEAKVPGSDEYRFNIKQLVEIIRSLHQGKAETIDFLLSAQNKFTGEPRFSPWEIVSIVEDDIITQEPGLTDTNLDAFKKVAARETGSKDAYEFSESNLCQLSEIIKFGVPIEKILDNKTIDDLNITELFALQKYYRLKLRTLYHNAFEKDYNLLKRDEKEGYNLFIELSDRLKEVYVSRIKDNSLKVDSARLNSVIDGIDKTIASADLKNGSLKLKYSAEDFVKDFNDAISGLSAADRNLVQDFYGLIISSNNSLEIVPFLRSNAGEYLNTLKKKAAEPEKFEQTVQAVKSSLQRFINNKVQCKNKPLETALNNILESIPEFSVTIGRAQHKTHAYTLDIHILKTLQNVFKELKASGKALTAPDKRILTYAALLHDIEKSENAIDHDHPLNSSRVAYQILSRTDMSKHDIERVCGLIRNHEWVGELEYSSDKADLEEKMRNLAVEFRRPDDFKLAVLLAKADLKAIGNPEFIKGKENNYAKYVDDIENGIKQIYSTGIYIPQTAIPKASQTGLKPEVIKTNEGETKNIVIDLNADKDLESSGFDKGVTPDNFGVLAHFIFEDNHNLARDIDFASIEGNDGIFCTSYVTPDNIKSLHDRPFGLVFDVEPLNIGIATHKDVGSGKNQNMEYFRNYLLPGKKFIQTSIQGKKRLVAARKLFSDTIKESQKLSDEQYIDFYNRLLTNKATPEEIQLANRTANKILLNNSRNNEAVVYAPIPAAVISKVPADQVSYDLRHYAETHDLPILIME